MPLTPSKPQRIFQKETLIKWVVLFIIFPIVLFLVLTLWGYFQVTVHLSVLVIIFILIVMYGIISDTKRRLVPDKFVVKFKDDRVFRERFMNFMDTIGLDCYCVEENIYNFDIKPQAKLRFAGVSFPPKAWGRFRIEIADTSATIFGPTYSLTILKGMIKRQLIEESTIHLPY